MIHMAEMGELVKDYVVLQIGSQEEQSPVQGYGAFARTGTPPSLLVAHPNLSDLLPRMFGEVMNARREPILGQRAKQREQLFLLWNGKIYAEMKFPLSLCRPRHSPRPTMGVDEHGTSFVFQENFSTFHEILFQRRIRPRFGKLALKPFRIGLDEGKSVAQQERELRTKADQLGVNVVSVYREDEDETVA